MTLKEYFFYLKQFKNDLKLKIKDDPYLSAVENHAEGIKLNITHYFKEYCRNSQSNDYYSCIPYYLFANERMVITFHFLLISFFPIFSCSFFLLGDNKANQEEASEYPVFIFLFPTTFQQ